MSNKKIIVIAITLMLGALCLICFVISMGAVIISKEARINSISNFEECMNSGYPVQESYPRRCSVPGGRTFTETIIDPGYPILTPEPSEQDIIVFSPFQYQGITSPLKIEGEAIGSWYWEGIFTIILQDESGDIIANTTATADEEWMQEDYVDFSASLIFEPPTSKYGTLVFIKENPSGLPDNNDSYSMPIYFSPPKAKDACVVTGCSSHICADEDQTTTCEFLDEYVCYNTATCEKQSDGECGWTETPELLSCIEENRY